MLHINSISKHALLENQRLTQRLEELNHKTNIKNVQQYNLETRIENLDIFEQHMTSLKLRCEFLDRQISNLEYQNSSNADQHPVLNSNISRSNDFNSKMEWRTTETTLENLCTEFKYLKEQLDQANEQISLDASFNDNSTISDQSKTASLFSENESCSMEEDDAVPVVENIQIKESKMFQATKKKNLMKMESFLNFKDTSVPSKAHNTSNTDIQLKGFKINNTTETPFYEKSSQHKNIITNKLSTKSIKKKLELVDLPAIDEEYYSEEKVSIIRPERIRKNDYKKIFEQGVVSKPEGGHYRHASLPDNSSSEDRNLHLTPKDSLKHFISDDLNLRSRYQKNDNEFVNFLFDDSIPLQPFSSFSPFSSFKDSYIDEEDADELLYNQCNISDPQIKFSDFNLYASDSDESYGSENATPLILRKKSKPILFRTQSHESVLTVVSRSTRNFPLREKNLDLKAQTMKWLKPNTPLVSSTTSSQAITADVSSSVANTAHDNIINLLNSGANNDTEFTPIKQTKPISVSHEHNSSWIPAKIFASPIPVPTKSNSEVKNSWISSLLPNSVFTTLEIGKQLNQTPPRHPDPQTTYKFPKYEVSSSFNGPSSSLTIQKNGNRLIQHGYGSNFNDTAVVSSRVSHGALREALQQDMI